MRGIGATRREERAGSEVLGRKCELGSGAGEVCFFVMCVHCSWSEFSCITAAQNVRAFKISDTYAHHQTRNGKLVKLWMAEQSSRMLYLC